MSILTQVISFLGGFVIAFPVSTSILKKLIDHRLNRDIEDYKSKLKCESDIEIEKLKTVLQINAKEREINLLWLHKKRAKAIESLYTSLIDLQSLVRSILDLFSPKNPQTIRSMTEETYSKIQTLNTNYMKAKIFLEPLTCQKIESVLESFRSPVAIYKGYLANYDDHELESLSDVKDYAWKEVLENVPQALRELETEFRAILGGLD